MEIKSKKHAHVWQKYLLKARNAHAFDFLIKG